MKLLVIGQSQAAFDLVDALRRPTEVSHVQDAGELQGALSTSDQDDYDWVLVDQSDSCAAQAANVVLLNRLRDVPVSKVSAPQASGAGKRQSMPMCAVETTQDGLQILRCALRHAAYNPEADPALTEAIGERPLVFEYHASRQRTG